jgi:hypothetical protein
MCFLRFLTVLRMQSRQWKAIEFEELVDMKVIILSYTGNVGKTTVVAHVLSPRMGDASIIAVGKIDERVAELGVSVEVFNEREYSKAFSELLMTDNVIVDVGASNIEEFLNGMARFNGIHIKCDCFIIPVTSGTKEQRETMSMIGTLETLGVPPNKIRLLFNRVEHSVEDEFQILLEYVAKSNNATVNTQAAIYENELFDLLAIKKLSIDKLLNDSKDYKALLREDKDADQKQRAYWADMLGIKALARGVNRNLNDVYAALFNDES